MTLNATKTNDSEYKSTKNQELIWMQNYLKLKINQNAVYIWMQNKSECKMNENANYLECKMTHAKWLMTKLQHFTNDSKRQMSKNYKQAKLS